MYTNPNLFLSLLKVQREDRELQASRDSRAQLFCTIFAYFV